jgi:hypothetical protein
MARVQITYTDSAGVPQTTDANPENFQWAAGAGAANVEDPARSGLRSPGYDIELPFGKHHNFIWKMLYSGMQEVMTKGVAEWSALTDYAVPAIVWGSDNVLYVATAASGPSGTAKNPITPANRPGYWDSLANALGISVVGEIPVGGSMIWNAAIPPVNYLEENGASLVVATYPELYSAIGYTYGGSGANFNIPDKRGKFLRGWDHSAGVDPDAASRTDRGDGTTGDNIGTKQADIYGNHNHIVQLLATNGGTGGQVWGGGPSQPTSFSGGNETRPKNINVMYCIRYQ